MPFTEIDWLMVMQKASQSCFLLTRCLHYSVQYEVLTVRELDPRLLGEPAGSERTGSRAADPAAAHNTTHNCLSERARSAADLRELARERGRPAMARAHSSRAAAGPLQHPRHSSSSVPQMICAARHGVAWMADSEEADRSGGSASPAAG